MAAQKIERQGGIDTAKEQLDIDKAHLEKFKKEFMEKPSQAEKVAALSAYLKPLIEKQYLIAPADAAGKFFLRKGPEVSGDRLSAVNNTVNLVNSQLAQMQDYKSKKVHIPHQPGTNADVYSLQDVFKDTLSDLLVDSALVSKITPGELSTYSADKLTELSKGNKLGALGALIHATENVEGKDLEQRNQAIAAIAKAMNQSGQTAQSTQAEAAQEGASASQNFSNAIAQFDGNPYDGLKFISGNIASKGGLALIDSVPKIGNLFAMLFSLLIPSKTLRNTMLAATGAQFLYGNMSLNKSLLRDAAGSFHATIGGSAVSGYEAKAGDRPGEVARDATSSPKQSADSLTSEEQGWLNVMNGKLPEADQNILKELFNSPVANILGEVSLERKNLNSSLDQWDISIKNLGEKGSAVLSDEAKQRLAVGGPEINAQNIGDALYRFFERVGTTWKSEIITSRDIPNGNAFAAERTPAYLGWLATSKVFSAQAQGDVNALAKRYIDPNQRFSVASALLLDRSPIKDTSDPYDNARKEVARIMAGHETWAVDAQKKEGAGAPPGNAPSNSQPNSKPENSRRPGPTTAPAPAFERTPENINRAERIEKMEEQGYYSRNDIVNIISLQDKTGLFRGRIERDIETQINNSVILLAQGHIDQVEKNINALLANFKDTKVDAAGTKMDREKTLRTLYLRFYKDERLLGHEQRIEGLIKKLSPSL